MHEIVSKPCLVYFACHDVVVGGGVFVFMFRHIAIRTCRETAQRTGENSSVSFPHERLKGCVAAETAVLALEGGVGVGFELVSFECGGVA